jgi:hypothetical protein
LESFDGYIDIEPQDFVVLLMARLRRDLEQVKLKPSIWWFVIQDLDLALTAQLVAYLSGTMQLGALKEKQQADLLAYLNDQDINKQWPKDRRGKPLVEQLALFEDLLDRAIDPLFPFVSDSQNPLQLSVKEKQDVLRLHTFRNELAHIKPRSWSLETSGLPRMALATLKAIKHLFDFSPQIIHLSEKDLEECNQDLSSAIINAKKMVAPTVA